MADNFMDSKMGRALIEHMIEIEALSPLIFTRVYLSIIEAYRDIRELRHLKS